MVARQYRKEREERYKIKVVILRTMMSKLIKVAGAKVPTTT